MEGKDRKKGSWVRYNSVDFGERPAQRVMAKVRSAKGGVLRILADGLSTENVIGDIKVPAGGGWMEISESVNGAPSGGITIYTWNSPMEMTLRWIG